MATAKDKEFQDLYDRAHKAGMEAGQATQPVGMLVQQHANPLNDNSPVVKQWAVPEGPCGFAWINIKPGNCAFANWLKKKNLARRDSYYGGVSVWVHEFNQSMQRKEDYAHAFAKVLSEAGITAYSMSRMD